MKTVFFASDQDNIEFTAQITMSLREWKLLKAQMPSNSHPSFKLFDELANIIRQAEKTYRPAEEE